jgi:hypothetical protein
MIRFETPQPERKFVTHDGPIWPVCRSIMQNELQIVARMSEDFRALANERGEVTTDDLIRLGWTARQIARHVDEARNAFLCGPGALSETVNIGAEGARLGASALAAVALVSSIACLCWTFQGTLA